jgi:hypothetical protein
MTTLVTVFSDASMSADKCGCGWWFKSDKVRGTGSRQMETGILNIHEVELWGIRNAILEACLRHPVTGLTLVVQCDNIIALMTLLTLNGRRGMKVRWAKSSPLKQSGNRKNITDAERGWLKEINECGAKAIYLKHVKGHTTNKDARSYVNNLTDSLASQARTKL